jgi:hypothetical protein
MDSERHVLNGNGRDRMAPASEPVLGDVPWMRMARESDLPELQSLAENDAHALICPTHVFLKDGKLVGCASVASVPLVLPWFHTERCHARDSRYFINQMENLLASGMPAQGPGVICVPFAQNSPFHPYIERLGYTNAGEFSLTFKKVR